MCSGLFLRGQSCWLSTTTKGTLRDGERGGFLDWDPLFAKWWLLQEWFSVYFEVGLVHEAITSSHCNPNGNKFGKQHIPIKWKKYIKQESLFIERKKWREKTKKIYLKSSNFPPQSPWQWMGSCRCVEISIISSFILIVSSFSQ